MAKSSITYNWGDGYLHITLGNRTEKRILALYVAEFIVTISMATIFLVQSFPLFKNPLHFLGAMGASLLYFLAARRFLNRMFFSEQLHLDDKYLTLIRKTLFSKQLRQYSWQSVGILHYTGKAPKTDHPLKGHSFDYFGFETREHLIQSLHHEGNLFFNTREGRVYFASGVYSWDAEDMVQMMRLFIGNALQLGPEWEQMLREQEIGDN